MPTHTSAERKKKKLKNLRFNRVDVVDMGANFDPATGDGSHILLMKRHDEKDKAIEARWADACTLVPLLKSVNEWVVKQPPIPIAKDGDPLDFDDALFARNMGEVSEELWKQFGALAESIDSVMFSDVSNKKDEVTKRVNAFLASVKKTVPGLMKEIDKRSEVVGWLAELTAFTGVKKMAFERKTLSAEAELFIKGIETSKDAEITKLTADLAAVKPDDKPAEGDDVLKGISDPAVRAAIEKMQADNETLRTEAKDDKIALAAETKVRLIKAEQESITKHYLTALTVDPVKDAPVFMKLRQACADEWKRVEEILKSAVEIIQKGGAPHVLKVLGTDRSGPQPESAQEIVLQKAAELMATDDKLDIVAAQKAVFKADPELHTAYRAEVTVK